MIEAEVNKKKKEKNVHKRHLKRANQVKIGHGGTLDPLATGVLILGIGSGTKALPQFLDCVKTYEAVILFGASTDTYDRVGRILTKRPYEHITRDKVEKALEGFRGKQTQIPPLYSALKMNGKPLYEYAREGKPIPREIEGRQVEVKEMELLEWYEPKQHSHRWPVEVAEAAERNLAEQVWRVKKLQETGKKLTAEEKVEEDEAMSAHESFKRQFEVRQDALIRDAPSRRNRQGKEPPMMSGALGSLPEPRYSSKGKDLIPEAPAENTPPPWDDEGPPACKIRMTVTSGYYVRSFCHDLGAKLESAGLMAELARVRQSDFTVGGWNCLEYDDLAKGEEVWGPQVANMLARWNGEPDSDWKPHSSSADVKQTHGGDNHAANGTSERNASSEPEKIFHRPVQGEKRRLSRSPSPRGSSPPRKVQARSPERPKPEDDEKSWSGIED